MAGGVVTGFHHLSLTVRDLDASASWYEDLFDLDTVMDEPGDDVDAWVQRLDAAGVGHSGRIDIPLGAILNFRDPDGIQLSISYEGD